MEKTPIRKLRNIYKDLAKKNCKNLNNKTKYFNYLNLSVHNSRDDRDFDENNFNLLKFLLKKNKNNPNNYFFKKKNKISGYTKYLFSLKESNYLLSKKLPLFLIFDLLKYFKQFLDISGIILIISFKIILNHFNFLNNKKFVLKNQKIYSIYYWIKKNSNSAKYYYPGYKEKSNKIFISSFADSKLFSKGLFLSLLNTNFITPAHILNIIELKISIFQFLHLFFYDFYIVFFKRKANFYSIWIGWKKAAEIFYSILIYNSTKKLAKNSTQCEFISWYENHITNRAFALGVSYSKKISLSTAKLSTFNGAIITDNIPSYFLPNKLDHSIGFIGEIYYVQDKGSQEALKRYFKAEKIKADVKKVPLTMLRTNYINEEKKVYEKSRNITIFTHATYWDLIACLLSIFNENNNCSSKKKILKKEKLITIRLHPSLNKKRALEEIYKIEEIPNYIRYEFINNKRETFIKSLKSSKYCYFGISTYVNLAIELNISVIAVETSHINKPPINRDLLNSKNLEIASPW